MTNKSRGRVDKIRKHFSAAQLLLQKDRTVRRINDSTVFFLALFRLPLFGFIFSCFFFRLPGMK